MWNSLALGELSLELSSHSLEWRHMIMSQDVERIQHWVKSVELSGHSLNGGT